MTCLHCFRNANCTKIVGLLCLNYINRFIFNFYLKCFSKMSYANQSQTINFNITGQQYQGLLERVLFSTLIGMPCCVFLFINGTMLFTLRSKLVFRETSRYILLYNLLFADTAQLAFSQLLYIFATCRIMLTYPVCGILCMFTTLTNDISPLTLVVMSLERYVAVCYPLRHATIITIRNTAVAIIVVWAISLLNVFTRVLLLLNFPFKDLESLQMTDVCSDIQMLVDPITDHYDKAYTYFLFVSATVAIISSYIGVMVAARSASADKASAHKARNTLLLHLVQLGLSLFSTMHTSIVQSLSTIMQRLAIVRIKSVFYVFIYIFPRCLTSLIYGLRDQTIRPILLYHLCCRLTLSCPSRG
uniref:Olfactory receptor-like protein OLF4 n=2 Tax=Seriola dumerili TaxID=41447 RepID=A0A3B4VPT1_SERDU